MRQFDGGGTSDMHKIAVLFSIYANNYLLCKNIYLQMGLFFEIFVKLHVASRKLQSTHKCASYYKLVKKIHVKHKTWNQKSFLVCHVVIWFINVPAELFIFKWT